MTLKEKTKLVREHLQMNQRSFAKIIGSNQTEVSFIERGFIPEDTQKIMAIAVLYKLHFNNE